MLEIVLTPKILGSPKSGALGLSLFSLMKNLRLPPTNTFSKVKRTQIFLNYVNYHILLYHSACCKFVFCLSELSLR